MIKFGYAEFDLSSAALKGWGEDHQVMKVAEEAGELVSALVQYKDGRVGAEKVLEEIADVLIMLEQTRLIIGATHTEVRASVDLKLHGLKGKLERLDEVRRGFYEDLREMPERKEP